MGEVVAIGTSSVVRGFALAGARIMIADGEDAVRAAWTDSLSAVDVSLIVLSPSAARLLGTAVTQASGPLTVVLPE